MPLYLGLLFFYSMRPVFSTSEYKISCSSLLLLIVICKSSFTMVSPIPFCVCRLLRYFVHCWMISAWNCDILPLSFLITFILGGNFLHSIFIKLHICPAFSVTRLFSISSYYWSIQRSLSCLAVFSICLQRSVPELHGMRDEKICKPSRTGRDGIGLIHYFVPSILVKRNRLKILWVHRILTRSKH